MTQSMSFIWTYWQQALWDGLFRHRQNIYLLEKNLDLPAPAGGKVTLNEK
jgi:hypothetical protein